MSESAFEYRQARAEYAASCADSRDLTQYLARIRMDAFSLRMGLAEAVTHVFSGTAAPSEGTTELAYPADRVERALYRLHAVGTAAPSRRPRPGRCPPAHHAPAGGRCRGCPPGPRATRTAR